MAQCVAEVVTLLRYRGSGRTPAHLQTSLVVHIMMHVLVFHPTPVVTLPPQLNRLAHQSTRVLCVVHAHLAMSSKGLHAFTAGKIG